MRYNRIFKYLLLQCEGALKICVWCEETIFSVDYTWR